MRHLIYLIDGTWCFAGKLKAGSSHTNIHKLNRDLELYDGSDRKNPQIIFYSRGVGAGRLMERFRGGGFAYGIWGDIEDVYTNICSNYQYGDKIYLFGFSRGAAVARVVAGLVDIGVLKTEEIDHMPFAIRAFKFAARKNLGLPSNSYTQQNYESDLGIIRPAKIHENVSVEFLGLFDTVIGGYRLSRLAQELNIVDSIPAASVRNCFQIHAIDETRRTFRSSSFVGANTSIYDQYLEQVWIPGVHSDIGGGYDTPALSDFSLALMVDRVIASTNLRFNLRDYRRMVCVARNGPTVSNEYGRARTFLQWTGKRRRITDDVSRFHPVVTVLGAHAFNYKGKNWDVYSCPQMEDISKNNRFSDIFKSTEFKNFLME